MSPSPEPPLAGSSSAPASAPHPQIPIEGPSQSTAPGAQRPTLTNTHIRSVADAQKLFYAVQCGLLPKVERRLDAVERKRLRPGDVYVWEERGATGLFAGAAGGAAVVTKEGMAGPAEAAGYEVGIERWTEGLSWSASRIRDEFLIYFENVKKKERGVDREGHRARSLENQVLREGDRDMYIKQTYSVLRLDANQEEGSSGVEVSAPGTSASASGEKKDVKKKPKKWHLNAYFTKSTEGNLNTIDTIPWLRDLVVPEGIFTSARQSKKTSGAGAGSASAGPSTASTSQTKLETQSEDTTSLGKRSRAPPAVQRTYAAFPTGERRTHPRPVVPAPPPPPPPLPPGSAPGSGFGTPSAPPQPPPHSMGQGPEDMPGARSGAAGTGPGSMHVLVPGRSGHAVQTVPLEPIDTTAAHGAVGDAASPASAGGIHVSTVGLYRMHIGEDGEPMRTDTPGAYGSAAFGAATFGDVGEVGAYGQPARSAFEFEQQQQQQLREIQRFQERQQAQQREHQRLQEQQQQQQFYGAAGFDFDAGQAFQHPHSSMQPHAHPQHHLHSHPSPHTYSPLQTALQGAHTSHPHSPVHGPLSPALSDFRASSEFSHSSSSSSSRGESVSSGSGSVRMHRGGAWSPHPDPSQFDFTGAAYHIKSEYSELGMAFGQTQGPGVPAQGAEGMFGGGAGDGGDGENDEDLTSAGRRRAPGRRVPADPARGGGGRGEQRVDVADMSGLAIHAFDGSKGADFLGIGVHALGGGASSAHALPRAQSSSSSLVDALAMAAPAWPALSPPLPPAPHRALSPAIALPSVPAVPSTPLSVPAIPSVPVVPPQPITVPSMPYVAAPPLKGGDAVPAEGAGKSRVLAPLHQLQRAHPYRNRNLHEERALRRLWPVPAPGAK